MIVLSYGANLPGPMGPPRKSLVAALEALEAAEVRVTARSPLYRTAPVPPSGQPDFFNGVALLETELAPEALMDVCHAIERRFGRARRERWAARTLDLDVVDYHGFVTFNGWSGGRRAPEDPRALCLPHPRAHERAFVLAPLAVVAPGWRHPVFGFGAAALLARLDGTQRHARA